MKAQSQSKAAEVTDSPDIHRQHKPVIGLTPAFSPHRRLRQAEEPSKSPTIPGQHESEKPVIGRSQQRVSASDSEAAEKRLKKQIDN